jgi:hypothetical protein
MKMHKIRSSNINAVGYDPAQRLLRITFRLRQGGESAYNYEDIDPQTYRELLESESPGRYFSAHIRGKPFIKEG